MEGVSFLPDYREGFDWCCYKRIQISENACIYKGNDTFIHKTHSLNPMNRDKINDDIYREIAAAIENDRLDRFMRGETNLRVQNPLEEELFDTGLLFSGLQRYASQRGDDVLSKELHRALGRLFGDPIGCWWALYLLNAFFFYTIKDYIKFSIDLPSLIPIINQSLHEHQSALAGNKNFTGYRFEKGLWSQAVKDARQLNTILDKGTRIDIPIN